MVSPGRKAVRLVRRFFSTNFDNNAFCISGNLFGGLNPYVTTGPDLLPANPHRRPDRRRYKKNQGGADDRFSSSATVAATMVCPTAVYRIWRGPAGAPLSICTILSMRPWVISAWSEIERPC